MTDWFRRAVDEAYRTLSPVTVVVGKQQMQQALDGSMSRDLATFVLMLDKYREILETPPVIDIHLQCFQAMLKSMEMMAEHEPEWFI